MSLKEQAYDIFMQINAYQANIQILSNKLNQLNQQIQKESQNEKKDESDARTD